jgi:hypothetical protein
MCTYGPNKDRQNPLDAIDATKLLEDLKLKKQYVLSLQARREDDLLELE